MCEDKIVNIISDLVGENMSVRKIGCHCLGGKCKATFVKSQNIRLLQKFQQCQGMGIFFVETITHTWR